MQDLPGAPSGATLLRWATFILAIANTMFIVSYGRLQDFASVLAGAGPPLTNLGTSLVVAVPAALLAGGFLLFYGVALWPRRRHVPIYTQIALPIVAGFLLAAAFVVALRLGSYGPSFLLLTAGAIASAVMFAKVAAVSPYRHSGWMRAPFSLSLAVLTVATIATGSYWLAASDLRSFDIDVAAAALPIGGALVVAIGAVLAIRYHEFVFPLIVAIAAAIAAIAMRKYDPGGAMPIIAVCVGMLVVSLLAAVASARDPRDRRSGSHGYAPEPLRASAAASHAAAQPADTERKRKRAKSPASSDSTSWQPTAGNPDTGPFQGPITMT